jgi:hypothetical protein
MNGFEIQLDYLDEHQEIKLLEPIKIALRASKTGFDSGRSRFIRFGWDYVGDQHLGPAPEWLPTVDGFDSWTINEYPPNHFIAPHIDSLKFGPEIKILSLGVPAGLKFISPTSEEKIFALPVRSLATMTGELRHRWKHATMPTAGGTRYSVVYRKLL